MVYDSVLLSTYTSGTHATGQAVGTNGFYQQVVRNLIKGTEVVGEIIDPTPNGVLLSFGGILAHSPVGLRRLIIHYLLGATPYTATDDGSGAITGTYCVGTLNHSTGVWTLVFDAGHPPATGNLTGDYLYGNPGADWRIMYERASRDNAATPVVFATDPSTAAPYACKETILHNTGISGTEDVYIGIREWCYPSGTAYGWDLNIYTAYNTNMDWNANQPFTTYGATYKHWGLHPMMPFHQGSMPYWIFSNRQRIVISVEASQYESMYLGFGRRYGEPSSYPFPNIAKAPLYGDRNSASTDTFHMFIADNEFSETGGYCLLAIAPDNSFIKCGGLANYATGIRVQPRNAYSATAGTLGLTPTRNRAAMSPVFMSHIGSNVVLMDLDGVKFCPGDGLAHKDILNADSIDHIVWRDTRRSTHYDFMCFEESYHTTTT